MPQCVGRVGYVLGGPWLAQANTSLSLELQGAILFLILGARR